MTTITIALSGSIKPYGELPQAGLIGQGVVAVSSVQVLQVFLAAVLDLDGSNVEVGVDEPTNYYIALAINDQLNSQGLYAMVNLSASDGKSWSLDGNSHVHPVASANGSLQYWPDGSGGSSQVSIVCTW
jgi:hypothetical protein